jgi:hypothetical protein
MTESEVIQIANEFANSNDWAWLGVGIARRRGWLFRQLFRAGKATWLVSAHNGLGTNVEVEIDDETGRVLNSHYLPR